MTYKTYKKGDLVYCSEPEIDQIVFIVKEVYDNNTYLIISGHYATPFYVMGSSLYDVS